MALMVMQRRRCPTVGSKVQAARVMAVLDTGAVIAAGGGAFGVGGAPAEAGHECWAARCGGVGGGGAVAVSVAHFDGLLVCVMCGC
jgi:hypothetical protein